MISVNLTEFRGNIKKYLDAVIDDFEFLVINRKKDKAVVVMSLDEYNSWQATMEVLSTEANRRAIDKAIQQYREGKMQERDLLEE
jgi:antitoxin YefM